MPLSVTHKSKRSKNSAQSGAGHLLLVHAGVSCVLLLLLFLSVLWHYWRRLSYFTHRIRIIRYPASSFSSKAACPPLEEEVIDLLTNNEDSRVGSIRNIKLMLVTSFSNKGIHFKLWGLGMDI
jgi:hypothetical protein